MGPAHWAAWTTVLSIAVHLAIMVSPLHMAGERPMLHGGEAVTALPPGGHDCDVGREPRLAVGPAHVAADCPIEAVGTPRPGAIADPSAALTVPWPPVSARSVVMRDRDESGPTPRRLHILFQVIRN